MATSSPAVLAAFAAGAGTTDVSIFETLASVLGGFALVWAAWALSGLAERYMDGALSVGVLAFYAVRALVLLIVLLTILIF